MNALTLIEGWEKLVTEACAVRLALARQNEAYFDELAEKPDVPLTELLVRDHGVTLATPLTKIVDLIDALRTKNREAERLFDTVHGEWKDYRWNLRGHPRVFDALFRARENALLPTAYTDQCFQHVTLDNMYDNQFWHMTGNALPRQPTLQAMASRVMRMRASAAGGGAALAPTVAGLIREQDRSASTADRERELDRVREATRATLTEAVTQWTDDMQAHKAKMERIASFLRDDLNMERVVTTPLRQARTHVATVCSNTVRDIDETVAATAADVRDRVRTTLDGMVQLGSSGGSNNGQLFAGRVAQAVADARAMPIPAPAGDEADLMVAFRTLARWRYRKAAREHMRRVISHMADRVDAVCDQPIGREVPGNVLATVKEVTRDMRMIVQMIDSTGRMEPPLAWEHDQMTAQLAHVRERDARANLEVAFASITALLRRHHAAGTSPAVAHHELLASLTQHRDAAAIVTPQTNALSHRLKDTQRELSLASECIIRVQWPRDEKGKGDAEEEKKYNDDEEEEEEEAEDMTSEKLVETLLDTLDAQLIPFLHAQEAEVRALALPVMATLPPLPPGLFMDWHVTPTRLFRDFRDAYLAHPDLTEAVDRADAEGGTRAMWAATLRAVLRQPDGTPKLDRLFHATHALVAILATAAHVK